MNETEMPRLAEAALEREAELVGRFVARCFAELWPGGRDHRDTWITWRATKDTLGAVRREASAFLERRAAMLGVAWEPTGRTIVEHTLARVLAQPTEKRP